MCFTFLALLVLLLFSGLQKATRVCACMPRILDSSKSSITPEAQRTRPPGPPMKNPDLGTLEKKQTILRAQRESGALGWFCFFFFHARQNEEEAFGIRSGRQGLSAWLFLYTAQPFLSSCKRRWTKNPLVGVQGNLLHHYWTCRCCFPGDLSR